MYKWRYPEILVPMHEMTGVHKAIELEISYFT